MIERQTIDGRGATVAYLNSKFQPVTVGLADIIKILFDDGEMRTLAPSSREQIARKSSDHPGGVDLHARPENAVPITGIPVADVVTRANVQHVSWEMVREGKYDSKPATLPLTDIIATQEIVDRQRVLRHMVELREEGTVEPKAPPLVILWDGDYFLLAGHHGVQAAYNLGVKEIGVMLMVAPI